MRKNSARKWLHAVLDLLPVILIPVFMIYSHRHDVTQDFEVVEEVPIYYQSNDVETSNDLIINNIYSWNDSWTNPTSISTQNFFDINVDLFVYQFPQTKKVTRTYMLTSGSGSSNAYVYIHYEDNSYNFYPISGKQFNFIILNKLEGFNYMPQAYVDCISSTDYEWVKEYQEVTTIIPKDVMTSFIDRFNYSIDNYFNMGNVFNLNNIYQWFNINIFGGNAPAIIFSVWNIVLYEFIMDLIFLLYALFMFFIDFCTNLIDRFHSTASGR